MGIWFSKGLKWSHPHQDNELGWGSMNRKMAILGLSMVLSLLLSTSISAGQSGTTDIVFNKRFLYRIKPMMAYEQLARDIGTPGRKTGEEKSSSPPIVSFRWDGGRKSSLEIRTVGGKVVEATVVSPRQHKLFMDRNGKISEPGG